MARISVSLLPDEREALIALARNERRDPRDQAALIIRADLQRAGLLPTDNVPATSTAQTMVAQYGD